MFNLTRRAHIERRGPQEPLQFAIAPDLVALRLAQGLFCDLWLIRFSVLDEKITRDAPQ